MTFQFGDFMVDNGTRQLLRKGVAIHLSPKAFDLLSTLIHERPRALTKADLHARLWPKTYVSDASLAMVVAEVRAALGESAKEPRHVRTLHRHGYAFQGSGREITTGAPASRTAGVTLLAKTDEAAIGYWLATDSGQTPLVQGDNIVGRDPKARVWLDAPSVSRQHAVIRIDGDRVTLEDAGSKNGTHVRGARITAVTPLEDGDVLRFGSVGVTFRAWAADLTRTEADSR